MSEGARRLGAVLWTLALLAGTLASASAARAATLDIQPVGQRYDGHSGDWDCLPATTAMALTYLEQQGAFADRDVSLPAVRTAMRAVAGDGLISPTTVLSVVGSLTGGAVTADAAMLPVAGWQDWVASELDQGLPPIAIVPDWSKLPGEAADGQSPHAVLITGFDGSNVTFNDPWPAQSFTMSAADFEAAWQRPGDQLEAMWFTIGSAPVVSPLPSVTPQPTPPAVIPGGTWITPPDGATETGTFTVSVHAYPTQPGDPPVDHVNVTLWWETLGPRSGPWAVACDISPPVSGDVFTCSVDPASLGAPPGQLAISFDVYDQAGDHNLAPNGEHGLTWISVPSPEPSLSTGSWTALPHVAEQFFIVDATAVLSDGSTLALWIDGTNYDEHAALLEPNANQWNRVDSPLNQSTTCYGCSLVGVGDGDALLFGLSEYDVASGTSTDSGRSFRFDHATGTWAETGSMLDQLTAYTVVSFADGRLLATNGISESQNTSVTTEIFDPSSNSWSEGPSLPFDYLAGAVSLQDQSVLAVSGGGQTIALSPGGTGWTGLGQSPLGDRSYQLVAVPEGAVAIGVCRGIDNGDGCIPKSTEVFDSSSGSWHSGAVIPSTCPAAVAMPDGQVVVAGGQFQWSDSLNQNVDGDASAYMLDSTYARLQDLPSLPEPVQCPLGGLLPNGHPLIVGQVFDLEGNGSHVGAYEYDP